MSAARKRKRPALPGDERCGARTATPRRSRLASRCGRGKKSRWLAGWLVGEAEEAKHSSRLRSQFSSIQTLVAGGSDALTCVCCCRRRRRECVRVIQ